MADLKSLDILIVDDDDAARAALTQALKERGARVRDASEGSLALDLLRDAPAALILVDQVMPGMDGVELITALRSEPTLADASIVMLTGLAESELTRRAEAAGANLILVKPMAAAQVVAALDAFLAKKAS